MYIDELDDIVNKYNNTQHKVIKMKPVDVKSNAFINSSKETNVKAPKFKVGDNVRIPEYKNISAKAMFQTGLKTFLWLKRLKILCGGYILLVILKVNKLLECFTKKNSKNQIKKSLELKRQLKENAINYMSNGKVMIILLKVGLIKKTYMSEYFSEPLTYQYYS